MEVGSIRSRIKSLLRSPSIRLRKSRSSASLSSQVTLERVVGITASGNSSLTCDPCSGTVAYPAGCVVVLLNPSKNTQQHLINSSRKTITALSFSSDGKYLVTGESGHLPAVRVWDVECGMQVAELQEHKYAVSCVTFSPNSKYIVSVGSQHDMSVNLWVWKRNTLVATNKVSSKVTAVAFSDDSSYFVTAGNRHVRFWYLEPSQPNKLSSTVPLMGRSGLLGELQNNFFCDVACGHGLKSDSTFCITSSGLLCEFNDRRVLEKWVHLLTNSAASLCVTEDLIFCACANGTVRVFSPSDLSFICTLPLPHHLGVNITSVTQTRNPDVQYPDSVAVTYDPMNFWLSCVYNDHSVYVWDTRDLQEVLKVHSALYHSDSVWDLQMFPQDSKAPLGSSGLFFSCSSDSTVRLWSSDNNSHMSSCNLLSRALHEVIYINDNSAALLDVERTAVSSSEKTDVLSSESRNAVRSICVSPDGRHLASGDRSGTLRIHDLTCMKEILKADVHESEILCLEYSKPHTGMNLLVTASRDRLIHVLDIDEDYSILQTLDEHSSSVTAVHFTVSDGEVKLISCGTDKSLYFHTAYRTVRGTEFLRTHHVVHKTTFCDMTVDPSGRYAAVGCQDRSVRVFNISSGKQKRSYKGSERDGGHVLKIEMDPSGVYVVVSCSDKSISLFDFRTGECLATVFGHSETISSLMFTDDYRYLISASGDSCIFVWRLAPEVTMNMREKRSRKRRQTVKNTFRRSSGFTLNVASCYPESERNEEEDEEHESHQKSLSEDSVEEEPCASVKWDPVKDSCADAYGYRSEVPRRPRRRWVCQVGSLELMAKSMLELRQLDCLSEARAQNRDSTERHQQRGSTFSLQDWSKKHRVRPHSAWLAPASTPEPEGVVLYSEEWTNTISSSSQQLYTPADVCQSPSSGFSVGYCSAESSPDQHQHNEPELLSSDDERTGEFHIDRQQISHHSEDVSRKHQMVSDRCDAGILNRPEGVSTRFQAQRSTRRSCALFVQKSAPTTRPLTDKKHPENSVEGVRETNVPSREPLMWSSPQRNHPYLSRVIKPQAPLQKSASVQNLTTDARRSLTPTRLRREMHSPLLKNESRAPPHHLTCLESWDSPNVKRISRARSYMSPTTSSIAKTSRSVSIGDGIYLNSTSCENLCPSTIGPGEGKARLCQRMSSPFAEWPNQDSSVKDTSADLESVRTEAVTNQKQQMFSDTLQRERPQVAVKAFSVICEAPADQEVSVSLEECRRAAAELRTTVQRSTQLYRTLMSSSAEGCVQQQKILWDALLSVGSELDSVRSSGAVMMEEGKTTLTLLEQYSELLLRSVEKRLQHNM